MTTTNLPFTGADWKIPGTTTFTPGISETYKRTPINAQLEVKAPTEDSFLYTRTIVPAKPDPERDPCNNPDNFKTVTPDNLWASLQATAKQPSAKPPKSNIALGDQRIDNFRPNYNQDYCTPFVGQDRLRSPNRNEDLAKTTASLKAIYSSAYNRVGDKALQKMITRMRERMEAKLGNSNDNAFRIRQLFLVHDKNKTGQIHFEDFRQMCESFGMQLDDDSLLSLYFIYDPEGTGYLPYIEIVRQIMQPDTFAYYMGYVDNSQAKAEQIRMQAIIDSLADKVRPQVDVLETVMQTFDPSNCGYLSRHDTQAACATLGIIVSNNEMDVLTTRLDKNAEGHLSYRAFCKLFAL